MTRDKIMHATRSTQLVRTGAGDKLLLASWFQGEA